MKRKKTISVIINIALLIAIGWGIYGVSQVAEDFIYWKLSNPDSYLARLKIEQRLFIKEHQPIRNWLIEEPEFQAQSVLVVEITPNQNRVLFTKNDQYPFVIASLTKLMTAMIAVDHYPLDRSVRISEEAVNQSGEAGLLGEGDIWTVQDLLRMSLMESSNDAAYALAETMGVSQFVKNMNQKAVALGLDQTTFVNPTGLEEARGTNLSSSCDLVQLTHYLLETPFYQTIEEMIGSPEFQLLTPKGHFHHLIINSNDLLGKFSYLIGGKTGYLPRHGGSLLSIFQQPGKEIYLMTIVLDSPDRFQETQDLIQWLPSAYLYLFNYGSTNSSNND